MNSQPLNEPVTNWEEGDFEKGAIFVSIKSTKRFMLSTTAEKVMLPAEFWENFVNDAVDRYGAVPLLIEGVSNDPDTADALAKEIRLALMDRGIRARHAVWSVWIDPDVYLEDMKKDGRITH